MKRGVSLLEAIVAIFLLAGGSLACFTLLIQAFRYQARSQVVTDATMAEQTLEGIRNWALQPANFDNGWAIYSNVDYASTDPPGFVARVSASGLLGPGSVVTPCYRQVTVVVLSGTRQVLSLTGQIGSPLRQPVAVTVESETGTTVGLSASLRFRAYVVDATSAPVPGVSFQWSVVPQSNPAVPLDPGLGVIESVGPNEGLLTHLVCAPPPPTPNPTHDPGWVKVRATCR